MLVRCGTLYRTSTAALQSRADANSRRIGKRQIASRRAVSPTHAAVRRNRAAAVATKVLVAATLCSGPAPMGNATLHILASGASGSLVMATVSAPASLALTA